MANIPDAFIHLHRYNERLMELFVVLSELQEKVRAYSVYPSAQELDNMQKQAEHVESRFEAMKLSLASLVREVESGYTDIIDAEQTDQGFRL